VATTVKARFSEEPVRWKMSKGKAKPVNELPRVETVWPVQNFQKSFLVRDSLTGEERIDTSISPYCRVTQKRAMLFS